MKFMGVFLHFGSGTFAYIQEYFFHLIMKPHFGSNVSSVGLSLTLLHDNTHPTWPPTTTTRKEYVAYSCHYLQADVMSCTK